MLGDMPCSWDRVYLAQPGAEINGVKEGMSLLAGLREAWGLQAPWEGRAGPPAGP